MNFRSCHTESAKQDSDYELGRAYAPCKLSVIFLNVLDRSAPGTC